MTFARTRPAPSAARLFAPLALCALATLCALAASAARAGDAPAGDAAPAPAPASRAAPAILTLAEAKLAAPTPRRAGPSTLRIAAVPVAFADRAMDPRFAAKDLEALLFSRGTYSGQNPSGEKVFGSMADFYAENSGGLLTISGKVHGAVTLPRPRASYEQDGALGKSLGFVRFLLTALSRLEEKEGKAALDGVGCVAFVIAGDHGKHGTVLWPHSAMVPWRGRLLKYYLMSETQGGKFAPVGVHCHELGHVLGILDKYGEGKHAGLGSWCLMAVGHRGDGEHGDRRPFHMCAWCKARLGWIAPATVDPRVEQTVRLRPVEGDAKGGAGEALKVLIDPDGSEYFLLENRRRKGFQSGFPRPGLLIWHVGEVAQGLRNGVWTYSIDLEEAHGDETSKGPFHDREKAVWPQPGMTAFTPWTRPGSTSWNLSALPVWLTDIREDGDDIVLTIGKADGARGSGEATGARRATN